MNIIKLIPYLLNKVAKVEKSVDNIDFSSLQEKSEKNQANGYIGLGSNAKFNPNYIDKDNNFFIYESFQNKGSLVTNTSSSSLGANLGANFTSGNHQINLINGNTNVKVWRSGISVTAGSVSTGALLYTGDFCQFAFPMKARFKSKVYLERNNPITSQIVEIGLLNQVGASRTGVFFAQDPTVNSGNWRVARAISGIDTYINTNIAYSENSCIDLELYYDKSTETCQYYINGTLVYTLTTVNLTNATLLPIWKLISNSSSQTTLRRLCVVDLYWSLEQ